MNEAMDMPAAREHALVMDLGKNIGFGRLMQLAEQCWREWSAERGIPTGSEHTVGPCAAGMVPCPCGAPVECDWCLGSGRVTKRVRVAMIALAELAPVLP